MICQEKSDNVDVLERASMCVYQEALGAESAYRRLLGKILRRKFKGLGQEMPFARADGDVVASATPESAQEGVTCPHGPAPKDLDAQILFRRRLEQLNGPVRGAA